MLIHRQLLNRNQHRYPIELELDFAEYIPYSTLMCGSRILVGPTIYHLLGNVISAAVGLVYINLQPEYELPSLTSVEQ